MRPVMLVAGICVLASGLGLHGAERAETSEEGTPDEFMIKSIGTVHKEEGRTTLVLRSAFEPALLGLDGFSHVWVLWWFDRNDTPAKRSVLQVHPRADRENPLTGVFATRAPVRPNLIGMKLCRIVSVTNGVVQVEGIDAFDGTPILDLKPYTTGNDRPKGSTSFPDWL